uniref:NTF2-related export protein 2-like n=1 Tax=Myxine glutinosa TaxID=7769 RepID=UPI00358F4BB6
MAAIPTDFSGLVEQSCLAAEEFCKHYYDTLDKRRHVLTRLYQESALLVWNGNAVTGLEALAKFYEELPASDHQVNMLDCQPIAEHVRPGHGVLVVAGGSVKFEGNRQRLFTQTFLLAAQESVWKIISDCFRFQD